MRTTALSLLTILCLMLAVAPFMAGSTLYSNGPYNGTADAWAINFGFSVSDSFTVPPSSSIEGPSHRLLGCLHYRSSDHRGHGGRQHLVRRHSADLDTRYQHLPAINQFGYTLYAG